MRKVKTLQGALKYVGAVQVCTLFSDKVDGLSSLWDVVDLPENSGGKTKWGARMEAVWEWKDELPARYPDRIFYGKLPGGHAVLMTLDYLRDTHYPAFWKPVGQCSELAQQVYKLIQQGAVATGVLRKQAIAQFNCTKSRFDTALKQLQITLNIVRSSQASQSTDTWVPFREFYVDLINEV